MWNSLWFILYKSIDMRTWILMLPIILLSACAPKHILNKQVIQENRLTNDILDRTQFYNTRDIVLTRYEQGQQENSTLKGKVTVNLGREVEQVVIRTETPGRIVQHLDGDRIAVSFEADESNFLVFGPSSTDPHTYELQAKQWQNGRGVVEYGGRTYYTNPDASNCRLVFKLQKNFQQKTNTRIAKGNKL